jgi:hypothetical protein
MRGGPCPVRRPVRVGRPARLPAELDSLAIYLGEGGDDRLHELLEGVRKVRALHLRGTRLSDHLALALPGRLGLEFIDIVDTGVSHNAIERMASTFPGLGILPNLHPVTRELAHGTYAWPGDEGWQG